MASTPTRVVNPARQLSAIRAVLSAATGTIRGGEMDCRVSIQPSAASQRYTVRLRYRHGRRPRVTVVDPPLTRHPVHSRCRTCIQATSCACTTPASGDTTCSSRPPSCPGPPNGSSTTSCGSSPAPGPEAATPHATALRLIARYGQLQDKESDSTDGLADRPDLSLYRQVHLPVRSRSAAGRRRIGVRAYVQSCPTMRDEAFAGTARRRPPVASVGDQFPER